jgi:aconitate hydratase 2/2-methylisocitrate dehydratase
METDLTVEQAFELSDASAERSAAGCAITLSEEKVAEYLRSNITMLKWMISQGYGDARTMARRVENMEKWLANPSLLKADADAEYTKVYEIDLADIKEPFFAARTIQMMRNFFLTFKATKLMKYSSVLV